MTGLSEIGRWEEEIFRIETDSVWIGGEEGLANNQGRQLANRTRYLKALVEALFTGKQDAAVSLAALATLAGSADKLAYFTGANSAALTTFTAFARTLVAAADAAAVRAAIGAVTKADIDSAVAALVNSSPATLDTLNEFAAALGNDPNFSTTIINLLAAKAPLLSPEFLGNPTAITPPQFNRSRSLATTEFVFKTLGSLSGSLTFSSGETLSYLNSGSLMILAGAGNFPMILPLTSDCPSGTKLYFFATQSNITIHRQGDNQLNAANTLINSLTMNSGDTLELTSTGASWVISGGSIALLYAPGFFGSISGMGYQKIPSGLIIQWGIGITNGSGILTQTMPIAYPTTWFGTVSNLYGVDGNILCSVAYQNTSSIQINSYEANTGIASGGKQVSWLSWGK